MKKTILLCWLVTATLLYFGCKSETKVTADVTEEGNDTTVVMDEKPAGMSSQDSVKHGEYMVTIMGCNDCHTPKMMTGTGPVPNPALMLSGHPADEKLPPADKKMTTSGWILFNMGLTAYVGPWGTSFSANLTPDPTGTGNWTIENFRKAIREGKFKGMDGGRMLLPPMPWQEFSHMTDHDLECIWKYLRSIKPVSNVVPTALPPA